MMQHGVVTDTYLAVEGTLACAKGGKQHSQVHFFAARHRSRITLYVLYLDDSTVRIGISNV